MSPQKGDLTAGLALLQRIGLSPSTIQMIAEG